MEFPHTKHEGLACNHDWQSGPHSRNHRDVVVYVYIHSSLSVYCYVYVEGVVNG